MIEFRDVCKTYNTKDGPVEAMKNVNLTIGDGEIYGVIGLSGAGKSTFIRCVNQLLQDNGILTLKEGAGLEATVLDIEENPYNVKIQELEAAQVARVVDEVEFVVLNGNYALEAGYSVAKDAIAYELSDSEAAKTYVNVIAVKAGNEDSEAIKALVDVLKSDEIVDFINETYDGAVIPFIEED